MLYLKKLTIKTMNKKEDNTIDIISQRPTKLANAVYVAVNEHRLLNLVNVFFYPGSDTFLFGHPNRMEKIDEEVYFIFHVSMLKKRAIKKYANTFFIDNLFTSGYDSKGKRYLRSSSSHASATHYLKPTKASFTIDKL